MRLWEDSSLVNQEEPSRTYPVGSGDDPHLPIVWVVSSLLVSQYLENNNIRKINHNIWLCLNIWYAIPAAGSSQVSLSKSDKNE